jgi:hypothetical protein
LLDRVSPFIVNWSHFCFEVSCVFGCFLLASWWPKFDRQAVVEIPSASVRVRSCAAPQKLRETVVRIHKIGKSGIVGVGLTVIRRRKVPIVIILWPFRACCVNLAVVEPFSFLRIA